MEVVANVKFLDGGFMAGPEASVSDGLLDLLILKDSGSLKMLDGLNNKDRQLCRRRACWTQRQGRFWLNQKIERRLSG